ncbi:MAG: glycosyltransferase family 39 protein [Candidatus Micrarchaeota archaeon]
MKLKLEHLAVLLIFLFAFIMRIYFLTKYDLLYGVDAGYYFMRVNETLTAGVPDIGISPPIIFYYLSFFSLVFEDVTIGIKVGAALLSAAMAFPFYFLLLQISKNKKIAILGSFLGAFSYANVRIMEGLLKNLGGLFFGVFFIYFLLRVFEEKKKRDIILTTLSFILMLGTHFSSTAYIVVSLFPFLLLFPAIDYYEKKSLTTEAKLSFCAAIMILICAIFVLAIRPDLITGEGIGTLGLQNLKPGQNWFNFSILGAYSIMIVFILLGLLNIYKLNKRHFFLFLIWLIMSLLLMQPIFVDHSWVIRFELMAYLVSVPLMAIGALYLISNKPLFYFSILLICLFNFYLFYQMGDALAPIITNEEWDGFLTLHTAFPNASFTGVSGGIKYWAQAAGLNLTDGKTANFVILQKDRHSVSIPPNPIFHFGRFFILNNMKIKQPNPCGDGICDNFEKNNEFICPQDCPR